MPKYNNIAKWLRGDWNLICDICGAKRKRSECRPSYRDGDLPVFIACKDGCADDRHPCNDPPPIFVDELYPVPDARPEPPDSYVASSKYSPYRIGVHYPPGRIGFIQGGGFSVLPKEYIGLFE